MITFVFPEHIQAGLNSGIYEIVVTASGKALALARDKATGRFVGHAVEILSTAKEPLKILSTAAQPFLAIPQTAVGVLQMVQTHLGFKETYRRLDAGFEKTYKMLDAVQNSVGILQATTALIGVGTVVNVGLSAVNFQQSLKLKEELKKLRLEIKTGFELIENILEKQKAEDRELLKKIAEEMKFENHRLILIQAYGHFVEALNWLRSAVKLQDSSSRNASIAGVQGMLYKSLADYNNPEIYNKTSSAGRLRRLECTWVIDQTITFTYQLQGAYEIVSDRLGNLQNKIQKESLALIEQCDSQNELDFIFPEIVRINSCDLAVLDCWKNHVDWLHQLNTSDWELLSTSEIPFEENLELTEQPTSTAEPVEQTLYEKFKEKSHYESLRDQLRFNVKPEIRRQHESYISKQAPTHNLNALAPSSWQEVPDLTVANLYHYFKAKEQTAA